jgi:hypothetical protein
MYSTWYEGDYLQFTIFVSHLSELALNFNLDASFDNK